MTGGASVSADVYVVSADVYAVSADVCAAAGAAAGGWGLVYMCTAFIPFCWVCYEIVSPASYLTKNM